MLHVGTAKPSLQCLIEKHIGDARMIGSASGLGFGGVAEGIQNYFADLDPRAVFKELGVRQLADADSPLARAFVDSPMAGMKREVEGRAQRQEVTIPFDLPEVERVMLARHYPEYQVNFKLEHGMNHAHGVAAASRMLQEKILLARGGVAQNARVKKGYDATYCDIGANPMGAITRGDVDSHSCVGMMDVSDSARFTRFCSRLSNLDDVPPATAAVLLRMRKDLDLDCSCAREMRWIAT